MRFHLRYATLAAAASGCLFAQGLEYVKANYTKYEYQIPMRDGKKLFTSVYSPKDTSHTYPILMERTPYSVGPYGADNFPAHLGPSEKFAKESFIFVYQDVRGRHRSEGEFIEMTPHKDVKQGPSDIDESSDTYDTIDWLVKNVPNNNGNVGMWGISYPGFYTSAGIIDAHPALKAASPQAPIADLFMGDDSYHNGAFFLAANFGFYTFFSKQDTESTAPGFGQRQFEFKTPNGYEFYLGMGSLANSDEKYFKHQNPYWSDNLKHSVYDEFWKIRNLRPHLKNIKPAIMTVGGWFDAEDLAGTFQTYRSIEKNSPGATNMLVVGPWSHGGWAGGDGENLGNAHFGAKTGPFFRDNIEYPFFNFYLKGKDDPKLPEAYVFETGTNQWRKFDKWPPASAKTRSLYLRANGALSFDAPADDAFDEYVSDPNKPVPYVGYTAMGMRKEYMTDDQRFASTRTDVLVYQTEVLDSDVTIAGPIGVGLHVSTSGTDSDWVVKVIDVYPSDYPDFTPNPANIKMGGYQQLVRGEPMRGKFRNSMEKPEPLVPGQMAKLDFTMPDVCHTFRRGHRIMVQVQSSWFPLVDRNPQKFVDIPNARAGDFQKATERVYRSRGAASSIRVNVL